MSIDEKNNKLAQNLCMSCMRNIRGKEKCIYCGENNLSSQHKPLLPKRHILNGRYIVGKVLDINGEGISYIGYDIKENIVVYIREFFPMNICERDAETNNVKAKNSDDRFFNKKLENFLSYFRSVAKLRSIPSISTIYDIFRENNTAYVICEWIYGVKLQKFIENKGGRISWKQAKELFLPLLSSLIKMHSYKVLHLGISPSNMVVDSNNKIRLVGFGTSDLRNHNKYIQNTLYDGCSALEQYIDASTPDESTDVYGFSATLFYALSGELPKSAIIRQKNDSLLMKKEIATKIPINVINAISNGLKVNAKLRTISFEKMKREILGTVEDKLNLYNEKNNLDNRRSSAQKSAHKKNNNFYLAIISCVVTMIILLICIVFFYFKDKNNNILETGNNENQDKDMSNMENIEKAIQESDRANQKQKIAVPNLVGKSLKSDVSNANEYKILVISEEYSDSIEEGCIISQNPAYGEEMYEGTNIAVNVSKGSKQKVLPDVVGKTLSEASALLTDLRLIPVELREYNTEIPEGTIIRYKDFEVGDTVDVESNIVLIVSRGKK